LVQLVDLPVARGELLVFRGELVAQMRNLGLQLIYQWGLFIPIRRLTGRLLRRGGIHIDEPASVDLMRRQRASLYAPAYGGIRQAGVCGIFGDSHSRGRLLGHRLVKRTGCRTVSIIVNRLHALAVPLSGIENQGAHIDVRKLRRDTHDEKQDGEDKCENYEKPIEHNSITFLTLC